MKANHKFVNNEKAESYAGLVPLVLTIVIVFALLFIGNFVNGTIHDELDTACGDAAARGSMNNTSDNWDTTIDIMQVTIIISVLATAIAAIFLFTKFA